MSKATDLLGGNLGISAKIADTSFGVVLSLPLSLLLIILLESRVGCSGMVIPTSVPARVVAPEYLMMTLSRFLIQSPHAITSLFYLVRVQLQCRSETFLSNGPPGPTATLLA